MNSGRKPILRAELKMKLLRLQFSCQSAVEQGLVGAFQRRIDVLAFVQQSLHHWDVALARRAGLGVAEHDAHYFFEHNGAFRMGIGNEVRIMGVLAS